MKNEKVLFSTNVPMDLSKEEREKRQSAFNHEVDLICKKYLELGFEFKRGFVFPETHDVHSNIRTLHKFPKELNIPEAMQKELAFAWGKLFVG